MKKIGIVLIIILAIGLGTALYLEDKYSNEEAAKRVKMQEELLPIQDEKSKLEQEIKKLDSEYDKQAFGMGTVEILFTGAEAGIYTDIYPIMKEYGYSGVVTLSEDQFPGSEGCMSIAQLNELLKAGWTTCIQWKADAADEKWLTKLADRMKKNGIPETKVLYFTRNTYKSSLDSRLSELGYTIAIHHGEEKLELVVNRAGEGVWHPGAVGMKGNAPRYKLEDAVSQSGNIVFTVGYEESEELYDSETFRAMLKQFANHTQNESLMITDPLSAREYRRQMEEGEGSVTTDYEEQKAALESRLSELEEEYQNIIEKYR